MSTFQDTKPCGGLKYLLGTLVTVVIVFATAAFAQYFLIDNAAAKSAAKEIGALELTAIEKIKADLTKKLPKDQKPDKDALTQQAAARFATDEAAQAAFEKDSAKAKHHAEWGLLPMSIFIAVAAGLIGGLYGTVLLVKRFKAANVNPWAAFLGHVFSLCFYMFVAFIPVLLYLAHHVEGGLRGFVMSSFFVQLPCVLATLGLVTILVAIVLPKSSRSCDHGCSHH